MENTILSKELIEAIHAVGNIIKSDARHLAVAAASEKYSENEELGKLLEEYSALQGALSVEYEKDELDEKAVKPLQDRMNDIYETVSNHPDYVAFKEASEDYEEFTSAVYDELEFAVTGHRHSDECTHDCSSCGGCH